MNRSIRPNRPGLQGSSRNTALLAGGGTLFELKAAPDTTTSIALTWNAAVPKPDNYRVERSLNGTTFSTVTTLANTDFSYTDTGRTESVQYWYRIVPILGGVDQPASNIADTWTVPATPTGLTATAISSTQINLAWTDVSTGNTAQSIQRRSPAGSGSYSFIASVGATANSYSDTGLTLATQYEYQVAATNPAAQSAWSTAANATTTGGGPPASSWSLDFSTGTPSGYTLTRASSATRVDSSGYIASSSTDVARLTHNSSGSRLGLLVEGQVVQICPTSETTAGVGSNTVVTTSNTGPAPDNTNTAELMSEAVANGTHYCNPKTTTANVDLDSIYCYSVFLKRPATNATQYAVVTWLYLTSDRRFTQVFDLSAGSTAGCATRSRGTPVNTASGIEDYGNGWYRCWVSHRSRSTNETTGQGIVQFSDSANPGTWVVDTYPSYNVTSAKDLLVWGHQMENGEKPSSYIQNTGTGSVTRSADLAYVETADVTNWGRPGSFVVEYYKPLEQSGGVVVADDDGAGNAGRLGVEYSAGGPRIVYGTSSAGSGGTDNAGLNKVGWAWDGSGAATRSALNGSALDTSLATSFDPTLTDGINLGGNIDWSTLPLTVSGQPNVVIRKVQFYNSQLSAADLNTLTGPTSYTVDALVVAGGGGGGRGTAGFGAGGGGAGGYRTATGFSLTPGTSYTITVGAGGAFNTSGSNSVFSTITSTGGGRGGESQGSTPVDGASGGSGGGGGKPTTTNTAGAGGAGTSGQGNNGGAAFNGTNADPNLQGGGGGGSGGTGGTGTSTQAGHGGTGTSSSITGTATTYAIGGGGGTYQQTPGDGDTSDGSGKGAKHTTSAAATAGRVNRGNGGGGGTGSTNVGGSGGSGVVILRMPTARYSGVHTPATVTTSGSDTILTFTSSGNYVA